MKSSRISELGIGDWEFGNYLGFGAWDLGFPEA
jgi:hypothetical protein